MRSVYRNRNPYATASLAIRRALLGVIGASALMLPGVVPSAQKPVPLNEGRAALMRDHFTSVTAVHDAVVWGDVAAARSHARTIAERDVSEKMPPSALPYLDVMRTTAARAAASNELDDIASMTGAMLALCGDCHRAVGLRPAVAAAPKEPTVGGQVGHMLAHKQAADLLVEGLTVPSESTWTRGAQLLSNAPLHRADLQLGAKVAREVLDKEREVHGVAKRAATANDVRARVYYYSEIVQSCGTCHSLHPSVRRPPVP